MVDWGRTGFLCLPCNNTKHKEEFRQTIGQREIVGWNRQEILIDIAVRLKVLRYPKENLPSIIHSNTYNEKGEIRDNP